MDQKNTILSKLDLNAGLDTPVTLRELYDAYRSIAGGLTELQVLLAEMAASYPLGEVWAVWGRYKNYGEAHHPDIFSIIYEDRCAVIPSRRGVPSDRRALYEFDTNATASQARIRARMQIALRHYNRLNGRADDYVMDPDSVAGRMLKCIMNPPVSVASYLNRGHNVAVPNTSRNNFQAQPIPIAGDNGMNAPAYLAPSRVIDQNNRNGPEPGFAPEPENAS